jgi:hypothetical protein
MTVKYLAGHYGGHDREKMGPVKGWQPPKSETKMPAGK